MIDHGPAEPTHAAPLFAALDLGTNNIRMLLAIPAPDGFRVVDSFNRIVRLGEGVETTGQLSGTAMARAIEAVQACAARLGRRPLAGLRAVATEACRRAGNGAAFLQTARAETGIRFELITAEDEAALAVESCAPLLGQHPNALLFDIGGGSTEIAWLRTAPGTDPAVLAVESLPLGVATLWDRHGPAVFTVAGFTAIAGDVAARLTSFDRRHRIAEAVAAGQVQMLGTSGTVTTLAGVALGLTRYRRPLVDGVTLPAAAAARAIALLRALDRPGLERHACVGPDRVEFVLPGCAIFAGIRALWPTPSITVADRGLREGMLLRLMRQYAAAHMRVPA